MTGQADLFDGATDATDERIAYVYLCDEEIYTFDQRNLMLPEYCGPRTREFETKVRAAAPHDATVM